MEIERTMRINYDWPAGGRFLRLYATPRMIHALVQHQRDADVIAAGKKHPQINRLHAVALRLDEYQEKCERVWPPLGRRGEK